MQFPLPNLLLGLLLPPHSVSITQPTPFLFRKGQAPIDINKI